MNEFIEQFLIEARELVAQAVADLLALEQQPADTDRLDGIFRAFHTLKGAAGIIEFAAMGRALHAAEDVLASLRGADNPVTQGLVDDCLACLDQVTLWLDALQTSGELPEGAEPDADALVARFAGPAMPPDPRMQEPPASSDDWLLEALKKHPEHLATAKAAVRYVPEPQCFFRGEDPLAVIATLPGLLSLDISPADAWPSLDGFDPFRCNLVLTALISATADAAAPVLEPVRQQVQIAALGAGLAAFSPAAWTLIAAQIALLAEAGSDGAAGRLASAGQVAANVLRHVGLAQEAVRLDELVASCQITGDAPSLAAALKRILTGDAVGPLHESQHGLPAPETAAAETTVTALRVDIARVDALVRLTGELTIVKNTIGHIAHKAQEEDDPKLFAAKLKEQHLLLSRLTGELQRAVLNIRVLPLRQVFQRFPRLVRDMAMTLGKPVKLLSEGEETDADKAIVESLFEPLLHVLRNAVDHGIESHQARAAAGKPAMAIIRLQAARQGEHLVVEVADDGAGVDVGRVRQVAAARGVASAEALAGMSDDEVVNLIFAPGFSTAEEVTDLSGRGVGMDAARETVARLGGHVRVESRRGQGTTVRFILPFTIMMSQVMTVEAGGQTFGIPLNAVVETLRMPNETIVQVGAARAFVLRNRTIPLCNLAEALDLAQSERAKVDFAPANLARNAALAASPPPETSVVIAAVAGQHIGLEVDRIGARMDVMLKPMDGLLSGMVGVAGTTLLGDGRVLLVLDLQELLQ